METRYYVTFGLGVKTIVLVDNFRRQPNSPGIVRCWENSYDCWNEANDLCDRLNADWNC